MEMGFSGARVYSWKSYVVGWIKLPHIMIHSLLGISIETQLNSTRLILNY